jgi:hypothetical protein
MKMTEKITKTTRKISDITKRIEYRNNLKQYHNPSGPAIVVYVRNNLFSEEWFIDGKRHRDKGPAVIFDNGHEEWWFNGKRHRIDGLAYSSPAYGLFIYDKSNWWVNGQLVVIY